MAECDSAGDIGEPDNIDVSGRCPQCRQYGGIFPDRFSFVPDFRIHDGEAVTEQFRFPRKAPGIQTDVCGDVSILVFLDLQIGLLIADIVLAQADGPHVFWPSGAPGNRVEFPPVVIFPIFRHGSLNTHHAPVFHLLMFQTEGRDRQRIGIQGNGGELFQNFSRGIKQADCCGCRSRGVAEIHDFQRHVIAEHNIFVIGINHLRRTLDHRSFPPLRKIFPVDPQQVVAVDDTRFKLGTFNVIVPGGQADPVGVVRQCRFPV